MKYYHFLYKICKNMQLFDFLVRKNGKIIKKRQKYPLLRLQNISECSVTFHTALAR